MEAVGRIEYGLGEGEFWRLTPRQFHYLSKCHAHREKRKLDMFRFLATATAHAMGHDKDYMDSDEPDVPESLGDSWDTLAAYLKSRAVNGATDSDNHKEPEGTPAGHEGDGDEHRAV